MAAAGGVLPGIWMGWMEGYQRKAWRSGEQKTTVTQTATVHDRNHYFSFAAKGLFLSGFNGKQPESIKPMACDQSIPLATDFR
ncbi:hypothetical protein BZ163_23995 [Pseudomonas sp. VI4.1]|jgi:hypothetical protein|nr:hypothetical protein BZ163_23995 [Pseudomonas sp. VI4.1]